MFGAVEFVPMKVVRFVMATDLLAVVGRMTETVEFGERLMMRLIGSEVGWVVEAEEVEEVAARIF